MIIQIYSMTSIADATMTAAAGADLVGVVVAEPGVVAEGIETAAARDILAAVRPRARGVALSLADDRDEICAMVDAVRPDIVHIAAREIEPEDCAWIRKRVAPVQIASCDRRARGRNDGRSRAASGDGRLPDARLGRKRRTRRDP